MNLFQRHQRQFLEAAWLNGLSVTAADVYEGAPNDGSWDPLWPEESQTWANSYPAWSLYEKSGRQLA